MKFVIFHGSLGTKDGNWFPDLKTKLEYMGQTVYSPQFPIDDEELLKTQIPKETKQNLTSWLETFEKGILPKLEGDEKVCFVGHSLGNPFILHVIEKFKIDLDCAIFVSPLLDNLETTKDSKLPEYYHKVNSTFYKTDFNYSKLSEYIPLSYVLYSNTDPYVEPHRSLHFAKVLNSSPIQVKKAGHFNDSVNMYEFPLVYDLCVSRLDLDLYQKYAYKMQFENSLLNLIKAENKVLKMTPQMLHDESEFHSDNLLKSGFATFVTNSIEWDPMDEYFECNREAAQRGLDITRVFVVKNKEDLKRELLKKQIKLDIEGGIKVYLIDAKELEEIGCEEDFGIWDNEYVCIQNFDETGELKGGVIDSRVKSLLTAQNWRDRIIRKSKKVELLEEVLEY
jgi:predicted alpha/beta hydrolase family esterase